MMVIIHSMDFDLGVSVGQTPNIHDDSPHDFLSDIFVDNSCVSVFEQVDRFGKTTSRFEIDPLTKFLGSKLFLILN